MVTAHAGSCRGNGIGTVGRGICWLAGALAGLCKGFLCVALPARAGYLSGVLIGALGMVTHTWH